MTNVLVTGGAGYIGSACVQELCLKHKVVVIDNLSRGKREFVNPNATFICSDVLDTKNLVKIMKEHRISVVMHFAAHKDVGRSMKDAVMYSENIRGTISVLDSMVKANVKKIIFSSSAAVYGTPKTLLLKENHSLFPTNYYGETKLISEKIMEWYEKIHGIKFIVFRYFNAIGDVGLNYTEDNPSNLIPIIVEVIKKKRSYLEIYGDQHETPDGTCVRDYIDIGDIVNAHVLGIYYNNSEIFNLGSGKGHSVFEIVKTFEKIIKQKIPTKIIKNRLGDVPILCADNKKAFNLLNWRQEKSLEHSINSVVKTFL